ncbi:hypothetical protein BC629DRAFT_1543695 [Irpex lacteus]|nr:hypothetical protein BC629DRAFT_1543695 [Irpex lacteus]
MSESQEDFFAQLVEALSTSNTEKIINVALLALVVYEHLITLEQEIEVVWRHQFSVYRVILLINRYCILAYTIIGVINQVFSFNCNVLAGLTAGLMIALLLVVTLLAAIRAFAISTWRYRILIAVSICTLGSVPIGADLYIWSTQTAVPLPILGGCGANSTIDPFVNLQLTRVSRAAVIAADLILLVVTWIKTFGTWKSTSRHNQSFCISQAILRDGTLYFLVFLALNISQIVVFEVTGVGIIAPFLLAFTSVLSSRFIINLRWIAHEQNRSSRTSMPSLAFPALDSEEPNDPMDSPDTLLARANAFTMQTKDNDSFARSTPLSIPPDTPLDLHWHLPGDDPFRRIPNPAELV